MNNFLFNNFKNVFSDNGEDGINEYLLQLLNLEHGILLEIGAWDGFNCSNIASLWSNNNNFKAILFEIDSSRMNKQKLESEFDNVECIVSNVPSENSLQHYINKSRFEVTNDNFVLASIDVDGDDLNVVKSLGEYRPVILIVEPNGDLFERKNPEGVTASEWNEYLSSTDYCFIGSSGKINQMSGNMYFIRNDYSVFFEEMVKEEWYKRGFLLPGGVLYE